MMDRYLRLDLKKALLIVGAWVAAVILHNAVYAVFGIEEAVFFIIAVFVIPLYLIISLAYTIYKKIRGE